jgi:transposase
MKAYSTDLRKKIVQSVKKGVSISETARRFGVNRSTVGRYLKRLDEDGSLAPKKAPGSPSKLDGSAMRLLEEDIKSRPWLPTNRGASFSLQLAALRRARRRSAGRLRSAFLTAEKKINRSE